MVRTNHLSFGEMKFLLTKKPFPLRNCIPV
uniref:Uncharacterized protein n=1 Tax=Anguilla anguilla TaxID=7936 RepID=A0A0E9W1X3_ANGAN